MVLNTFFPFFTLTITKNDENIQNKAKKYTKNNTPVFFDNCSLDIPESTVNEEAKLLFNEITIRRAFTIKVFSILSILLVKTLAFSILCMYYMPLKYYWRHYPLTILYPIPIYLICAFGIIFKPSVRKRTPWNYINLFVFSTCISIMIGGLCSISSGETILIGFGITTILVLGLAIFAFQTKYDLTQWRMFSISFSLVIISLILTSLTYENVGLKLIGACLGVIIFSIYLITDIQQIIVGNHAFKISPEDHILAVTILYLDIINLFLNILKILK